MNRREFLTVSSLALPPLAAAFAEGAQAEAGPERIDRHALVTRHNIGCNTLATTLPLGNGEFCFTADATGLQTFAGNAMAHWGWHSFPLPTGWTADQVPVTGTFQRGRNTGGDVSNADHDADAVRSWMFDNPHRMNLGRLRLRHGDGQELAAQEITAIARHLDLWSGAQTSRFTLRGRDVQVQTCVHPTLDAVAIRIESALISSGELEVALDFPYPALGSNAWVGDFARPDAHHTLLTRPKSNRADFERHLDAARYHAALNWSANGVLQDAAPHSPLFRLTAHGGNVLELVCAFHAESLPATLPSFAATRRAAAARWAKFWKGGGAIDLSGSRDPRWKELERRVVLSQYHTAAQSSGSWPPAETGLLGLDPWRGQFHMEMVWWHLAHFALWDRWDHADRALDCYQRFVPSARALATQLGYRGLKWPKSVGPEGRSAPWVGNQVLLWKQPHPIFFAELEYRLRPTTRTLNRWRDIVIGTAEHMADYPTRDAVTGLYSLAPAMPPSEQGITRDTVFDLAYWRWGLDAAQRWRERCGLAREPHWDDVRQHLSPLPTQDGVFVHSAEWHDTYTRRAWEHPDPVGVLGMLPPIKGVDPDTAHRTVVKVWQTWDWNRTWGWDCPWMAMAAARVGEPQIAIEALLKESPRNRFDERGINVGGPCPYLPGNGGLLYAIAMMAASWDGAPDRPAPGFPSDGSWTVRWEGLKKAP
ncbi:MAG: hypothetical protein JWL77_3889 [Chthonomonadaceae bacterium]|nr:hypothetical protein [Chthonomonadaceae bacterium]